MNQLRQLMLEELQRRNFAATMDLGVGIGVRQLEMCRNRHISACSESIGRTAHPQQYLVDTQGAEDLHESRHRGH